MDEVAESFLALEIGSQNSSGSDKEERREEIQEFLKQYKGKVQKQTFDEESKQQELRSSELEEQQPRQSLTSITKSLVNLMDGFLTADPFAGPRQQVPAGDQKKQLNNMKNGHKKYMLHQKIVSANSFSDETQFVSTPPNRDSFAGTITLSQILQKKANQAKNNFRSQTQQVVQPGADNESFISNKESQDEDVEEHKQYSPAAVEVPALRIQDVTLASLKKHNDPSEVSTP